VVAAEARRGLRSATIRFPCCCCCCGCCVGGGVDGDEDGDTCWARAGNRVRRTDADHNATDGGGVVLRPGTPTWGCM